MSIYKLTQKDAPLIEKLEKEVDLKELIPNIDKIILKYSMLFYKAALDTH